MIFETRYKAWEHLSTFIKNKIQDLSNTVILWILKWWVPITYQVSQDLDIPSSFLVVKNLIYNNNKFWVTTQNWINIYNKWKIAKLWIDPNILKEIQKKSYEEAKYDKEKYWLNYNDYAWKQVIIVDDGCYSWLTAVAASKYAKQAWASRIILAVPVANNNVLEQIKWFFDEIICIERTEDRTFNLSKYYMSYYSLWSEDLNELFYKMKEKWLFLWQ